ncbi:SF0329 family protein [Thiorhodococcus drewsii]|uniref:SF0329 family protein n=1 Tax=Thiorhodococcus drewsii TaxID=210408 RepID=UPI0009FEEBDF|nr:hypothetical protein [Thiorhodococcus drewsii]
MSRPWSKFQKEFYLFRADGLDLQLQCRSYRMDSNMGSTNLPRYWITLGKEVIWGYPKDFVKSYHPSRSCLEWYPYLADISAISVLVREYIDTPKNEIMSKTFEGDYWGLINILRASDKRIGARRLPELRSAINNKAAQKVIAVRLDGANN